MITARKTKARASMPVLYETVQLTTDSVIQFSVFFFVSASAAVRGSGVLSLSKTRQSQFTPEAPGLPPIQGNNGGHVWRTVRSIARVRLRK
jgi:hypothetical protein